MLQMILRTNRKGQQMLLPPILKKKKKKAKQQEQQKTGKYMQRKYMKVSVSSIHQKMTQLLSGPLTTPYFTYLELLNKCSLQFYKLYA